MNLETEARWCWEFVFKAPTACWDVHYHVMAPTVEQATMLARKLQQEDAATQSNDLYKQLHLLSVVRLFRVDAMWQLPLVKPTRPTIEQQASAEVENLLETV